jgi:hypothetical protein
MIEAIKRFDVRLFFNGRDILAEENSDLVPDETIEKLKAGQLCVLLRNISC